MSAFQAQSRRRKPATYGKASRSFNTWNSGNLDALDEDEISIAEPTVSRTTSVTQSYSIKKHDLDSNSPKSKSKPEKKDELKHDVWDVPSSESSEDDPSPVKRQPAPKFGKKGKSDKSLETTKLAPWEKAKLAVLGPVRRSDTSEVSREVSQASEESHRAHNDDLVSPSWRTSSPTTKVAKDQATVGPTVQSSPDPSSAAARLQAKRLQSRQNVTDGTNNPRSKRTVQGTSQDGHLPRKRLRSDNTEDDDVSMGGTPSCVSVETGRRQPNEAVDNEEVVASPRTNGSKAITELQNRRGKITTFSSPRKMESAPARLSEMLPVDTDTTDDTRSPSITTSRPTTPQVSHQAREPPSPQTALRASASKRQSQLLSQLLPNEAVVPSPSTLSIHSLVINSARRPPGRTNAAPRTMLKSSSDVGHPRTKLVDRLKASALSSDEDSSDEDGTEISDVEMSDAGEGEAAVIEVTQSQSQSQSQTAASRPKVTYAAAQRSWLKEESFEEELMLDVPAETRNRPVGLTRSGFETSNSASQSSAFDMEDSDDDDGAAGRLRTIHELRAGGVNQRFMDDIGSLMEDISNHSLTARGRRRSALMEVAKKLADKSFVAKFYRQGFEQQLLAELVAPSDDIADFNLSVIVIMLMIGEPPDHAAQSLKDAGTLALLVRMLSNCADPRQLAKERRNNVSKAAQADFSLFIANVTEQQSVWGELKPVHITQRIIALKALDLLVSRLRRSGDRSELLSNDEVQEVMPSRTELDVIHSGVIPVDITLSIAVLESLSTTTASLLWPIEHIEALRTMLAPLAVTTAATQHLRFLTLRLCLNLTNGNQKNCKVFDKADTVFALLRSMTNGFEMLFHEQEQGQRTINLDLLVLSMGIMINLTEQKSNACDYAASKESAPLLATLVDVFLQGQQRTLEAESEEDGVTNVAFGYLAVVLANICRSRNARHLIASLLPDKKLTALVAAVYEFVVHHQKVDALTFEGEEGTAVWSAFTERLKRVLSRLTAEAEADEIDRH